MGKEISDLKSQLVIEICNLPIACVHKSPFIDWYLVLQVEETAGLETMRKQYRKLALQLHPDKNKHPKADIAFKILLEAYSCLSNNARRAKFNLERKNIKCLECKLIESAWKIKGQQPTKKINYPKISQKISDLKARLSEEAKVIENCLKSISESKRRNLSKNDYPVFNPDDYSKNGYTRRKTKIYNSSEKFHCLWKNNVFNYRLM